MKKFVIGVGIMMGLTVGANAQTAGGQSSSTMQGSSTSSAKKNIRGKKGKVSALDSVPNNRVIYRARRTGQKATPTGQDATGSNGTQANNPKNAGHVE